LTTILRAPFAERISLHLKNRKQSVVFFSHYFVITVCRATSPPSPFFLVLQKKIITLIGITFLHKHIIITVMKMKEDLTLHGNNAKVGKVSKQENSRNLTNTAAWKKGQPFDAEFAKEEVDHIKL
jgi:hypothetical protein